MNVSKKFLIIALLIPIIALAGLAGYKKYKIHAGTEYILPIHGYDPRDLLSGHYLIYQIDYGIANICAETDWGETVSGQICLDPLAFSYNPILECRATIPGICNGKRFNAGIERFFVPQEDANILEKAVIGKKGSLVLSVGTTGKPVIKDLLIEGKPWREHVKLMEKDFNLGNDSPN